MRALRLARWLLPSGLRRGVVPLSLAALGVGLLGAALPMIADSASATSQRTDGLGSAVLRVVEVGSYGLDADPRPIDRRAISGFRAIAHVESAVGRAVVDLSLGSTTTSRTVSLITRIPVVQPPLLSGREPTVPGEVVVSRSDAAELHVDAGDTLGSEYTRLGDDGTGFGVDGSVTVVGVYDDEIAGIDGPHVAYGVDDMVLELLGSSRGHSLSWMNDNFAYPKAFVVLDDAAELSGFVEKIRDEGYSPTSLASMLTGVSSAQSFLNGLQPVLIALLVLQLVVVGWSTSSAFVSARRGEVGVLRALGWRPREIVGTFVAQFAAQGAVVGIAGAVLALLAAVFVASRGGLDVLGIPLSVTIGGALFGRLAIIVAGTIGCFVLAAALPVRRAAAVEPDEVIRELGG